MTHRPAVWILVAFAGGIMGQQILGEGLLFVLVVLLSIMLLCAWRQRRYILPLVFVFVFFVGAFDNWQARLLPLNHVAVQLDELKGRERTFVCRVVSWPQVRMNGLGPRQEFLCAIENIDGQAWQGRVMVRSYGERGVFFGQRLRFRGRMSRPYDPSPGGRHAYVAWLERQGIYAQVHVRKRTLVEDIGPGAWPDWQAPLLFCRTQLQDIFRKYLFPGEAGLMNAMLLGPRDDIPAYVYDIFRRTGTAHIIAISGMNMTLTAFGLMLVLGMFNIPRVARAWLAVMFLGFYALMAGSGAPVARSAVMAAVVLLSFVLERETDAMNNLSLAGVMLLAADPRQLQDIGFQLSFVCVASLILLVPLIMAWCDEGKWCPQAWARSLLESAAVTLAAFIGSAGILAYVFGYLAPVGLLVNLPVIPLMGLVTGLGFLVLAFGIFIPWMAWPFAFCLKAVLNISVGVLMLAAHMPVLHLESVPLAACVLYYVILLGLVVLFYYHRPSPSRTFIDKPLPL